MKLLAVLLLCVALLLSTNGCATSPYDRYEWSPPAPKKPESGSARILKLAFVLAVAGAGVAAGSSLRHVDL